MCLFPRKNKYIDSITYKYGITHFDCGVCPECLAKKSKYWQLRACMEAKSNIGCMVTLTYDTYERDLNGNIIGENPVNPDIPLDKRDVQGFLKRLRAKFPNNTIKYIAAAERGKRTNRAHFHLLLFGVEFTDRVFYKKSKRGNIIYKSKTLEKIWQGGENKSGFPSGICTIDCVNINAATARYCTKYAAKDSGLDDTFMLYSHGIGEAELRKRFNGKPYIIDGHEFSIPKSVWKWYICNKYGIEDPRYFAFPKPEKVKPLKVFTEFNSVDSWQNSYRLSIEKYFRFQKLRDNYRDFRDNDPVYMSYIAAQKEKGELNEKYKRKEFDRILALDNGKYWSYKQKCIEAIGKKMNDKSFTPPRFNSPSYIKDWQREHGLVGTWNGFTLYDVVCRRTSRHKTANDRILKTVYQVPLPSGGIDTVFLLKCPEEVVAKTSPF